jgi:hypothetical protein
MSLALIITEEDIALVLGRISYPSLEENVNEVYGFLNFDDIQKETLKTDELDEQIELAYQSIEKQILDNY